MHPIEANLLEDYLTDHNFVDVETCSEFSIESSKNIGVTPGFTSNKNNLVLTADSFTPLTFDRNGMGSCL